MDPGTIYMYYSRGGDSLNFTCNGHCGNAVLVKSGYPTLAAAADKDLTTAVQRMRQLNPKPSGGGTRHLDNLCNGQTLLCKSLGIKVKEWDCQRLRQDKLKLSPGERPSEIIQTTRLGIPSGRDEDLPYRFIHSQYVTKCTKNPLTMRKTPTVLKRIAC